MNPQNLPASYPYMFERILQLSSDSPNQILTLAITGPDCAGKSTVAKWLANKLDTEKIPNALINGDEYIRPRDQRTGLPTEAEDYYRHGFDFERLVQDLHDLRNHTTNDQSPPAKVIIVEGVFLLKSDLRHNWDASFWLDIPEDEIVERGSRRDAKFFGSELQALEVYLNRIIPAQRIHQRLDDPEASATVVYPFIASASTNTGQ